MRSGGSLSYIDNGWGHAELPAWSMGFVHLPALVWMIPASMLMAPLGAKLTDRLPVVTLKRVFAGLLDALAAKMLWKLLSCPGKLCRTALQRLDADHEAV